MFDITESGALIVFGKGNVLLLGTVIIKIYFKLVKFYIMDVNILFLLSFINIIRFGIKIYNMFNQLVRVRNNFSVFLDFKFNYL